MLTKLIQIIMYVSLAISIPALIFWILGTTAGFQRMGLDLLSTVVLAIHWVPTLVLTVFTIVSLKNGLRYKSGLYIATTIILIIISVQLFTSDTINTYGWLRERVTSGNLHSTQDGKFEYRLDLINLFQRNSSARLFVRNLETREEKIISLPMNTRRIGGVSHGSHVHWITMEPTNVNYLYIVRTVNGIGWQLDYEAYKVDIEARTAIIYDG